MAMTAALLCFQRVTLAGRRPEGPWAVLKPSQGGFAIGPKDGYILGHGALAFAAERGMQGRSYATGDHP
jgi:hypothetical protein